MKKINKIIILLFAFFICISSVYAAEKSRTVSYGSQIVFVSSADKEGLTCTGSLTYLKLEKVAEGYAVSYTNDPSATQRETVTCSFTKDGSTVHQTYSFTIKPPTNSAKTIYVNNVDGAGQVVDIGESLWSSKDAKVISASIEGTYVTLNCPKDGNSCKGTISNYPMGGATVKANIEYSVGEKKYNATVSIVMRSSSGVKAKIGSYGTCTFDSNWNITGTTAVSTKYGELNLPSCTPNTSKYPLSKFEGWSEGQALNDVAASLSNSCAKKLIVTGSGKKKFEKTTTIYACYSRETGAVLYAGDFNISGSGWTSYGSKMYYSKANAGGKVTLPTPTETEVNKRSFKGWKDESSGTVYEAGATVDANSQRFTPVYETIQVYTDYNKTIYLGQNALLKPYGVDITSCTVGDPSYVQNTSAATGECQLFGLQITGDTPVQVAVVGTKDGKEYSQIFYVTVLSPYSGESVIDSLQFEVNITPNVVSSFNNYTTLNGFQTDSCDEFKYTGIIEGPVTDGGALNLYKFEPQCSETDQEYQAYCIDAGREIPTKNNLYRRSQDINSDSDYAKLINYMASRGYFKNTPGDNYQIAVNTLLRVIGYIDGITVASGFNSLDLHHANFYQYYVDIADILTSEPLEDGNFAETAVDKALRGMPAADLMKPILLNYKTAERASKTFKREIEHVDYCEDAACTTPYSGTGNYYVKYSGTISTTLGNLAINGIKNPSKGVGLVSNTLTLLNDDGKINEYEYEIVLSVSQSVQIPKTAEEEKEMSVVFTLSGGLANNSVVDIFIAEATGIASTKGLQRMVMFNKKSTNLYVYFSPALNSSFCNSSPMLDNSKCTDSGCPSPPDFNASLFAASGCCNFITDESSNQFLIDNVCSNKCSSTTLVSVCDYREEFTGNQNEVYDVTESQDRQGNFKIGGRPSCIVVTENKSKQIATNYNSVKSLIEKEDEAGNSLMVDEYKGNRYCRVSCAESWQLTMESFGNYLGANAVAAGSYFQTVADNMYIGGKRTCFTTFINYGTSNDDGKEQILADGTKRENKDIRPGVDEGFTADVSKASDDFVDAYNKYANLSHIFSDLSCQSTHEDGYWDNYCVFNPVRLVTARFCSAGTPMYYCLSTTNMDRKTNCSAKGTCGDDDIPKGQEGGENMFRSYELSEFTCHTWVQSKYRTSKNDGGSGARSSAISAAEGASITSAYGHSSTPTTMYSDLGGKVVLDDMEEDDWECDCHSVSCGEDCTTTVCDSICYSARQYYHHEYTSPSYNRCDTYESDKTKTMGWGICVVYYLATNGQFNDKLPSGYRGYDYQDGEEKDNTGNYVKYFTDSGDGILSSDKAYKDSLYDANAKKSQIGKKGVTRSIAVPYTRIPWNSNKTAVIGENKTTKYVSELRTGDFIPDELGMEYAYYTNAAARKVYANDNTKEKRVKSYADRSHQTRPFYYYNTEMYDGYARLSPQGKGIKICEEGSANFSLDLTSDTITGTTQMNKGITLKQYNDKDDYSWRTTQWETCTTVDPEKDKEAKCEIAESILEATDRGDTPQGEAVRAYLLDASTLGHLQSKERGEVLEKYVKNMNSSRSNLVSYAQDMYACQHFELYNTSDDNDDNYKNNTLSSGWFLGVARNYVKINTAYKPDISYTYDEEEYMSILGDENVMVRFQALNSKLWCDYDMEHRSSDVDKFNCYNQSTNMRVEISTGKSYYSKYFSETDPDEDMKLFLSRNFIDSYYYDTKGVPWNSKESDTEFGVAESYGASLVPDETELSIGFDTAKDIKVDGVITSISRFACNATAAAGEASEVDSDCNLGEQVKNGTYMKRSLFCTIGEVDGIQHVSGTGAKGDSFSYSYTILNSDAAWTDGKCYVVEVQYVRANYIKTSIENSSFFVNRGNWYLKDNDIKSHGDNLEEALKNSGYSTNDEEKNLWTKIGSYNVFPIKMTTPRGIYTYTYTFSDIGSTSTGKLGRIMGSPTALISKNSRMCFYEVFEDVCLCCGNLLDTEAEIPYDEYSLPKLSISRSEFTEDQSKYATLGFFPATVSLSDMEPGDVELANNWKEQAPVFYNGDVYTTDKGSELLTAIEEIGDNAYNQAPEYSYSLTPGMLSAIRDYNDEYGYGVSYDRLVPIGKYAVTPFNDDLAECEDASGCYWEVDGTHEFEMNGVLEKDYDIVINFQHYGSEFLTNEIIYRGYDSNSVINVSDYSLDEDCYVEKGTATAETIREKVEGGCRWVDYVEVSTSIPKYPYQEEKTRMLRLAFK